MEKSTFSKSLHLQRRGCCLSPAQIHGLTYAAMRQDPHEFIIDTEWKTATLENHRKERPVTPIKATSMTEN